MHRLFGVLLVAGAALAQPAAQPQANRDLAAERQQALDFLKRAQPLNALPLVEDLAAANPDDPAVQGWLAYCLFAKSRHAATPEESPAVLKRAREAALRARQLGSTWPLLNDLLSILDTPGAAQQPYSNNAEVNARMKEGEEAFARGDNEAALAAYSAALKIDPKLYTAALFAGDVCFRRKELARASEWFGKAVAIDPARETAYRYWGDALMAAGKMLEARDKFIEAVIAEPAPKAWAGLANWAKQSDCQLSAPQIERPKISDNPQTVAIDPKDLVEKDDTGRSAWVGYSITRAAWRQEIFARNYPKETQYRHTLAEEVAALSSVADVIDRRKATRLDPQLANLILLKGDGLLEAWILLNGGADAGIARDYAAYRDAHHEQLRAYFDKYIIHPNSAP